MPDPRFPGPRTFVLPEETPPAGAYLAPTIQGTPSQTFRMPAMAQQMLAQAMPRGGYEPTGGYLPADPQGVVPPQPEVYVPPGPLSSEFHHPSAADQWFTPKAEWGPAQYRQAWLGDILRDHFSGRLPTLEDVMAWVQSMRKAGTPYEGQPLPPNYEDQVLQGIGFQRTPQGFVPLPETAKMPLG